MNLIRTALAVLICVGIVSCTTSPQPKKPGNSAAIVKPSAGPQFLTLTAVPKVEKAQATVSITLSNCSSQKISVEYRDLPWISGSRTLSLNAFTHDDKRERLPDWVKIADYGPHSITIDPKGVFTGQLLLNGRLEGLASKMAQADIMVYWVFRMPLNVGGERLSDKAEGMFLLPKSE